MPRIDFFADLILPLPLHGLFTYRVPQALNEEIQVGQRVVVPFGRQKNYAAIVYRIHQNAPENFTAKYIRYILDPAPLINKIQFQFWDWISSYYLSTLGEVMNAALPSGFNVSSETTFVLSPYFDGDISEFSPVENQLLEILQAKKEVTVKEIQKELGISTIFAIIKSLTERQVIVSKEEINEKYIPKIEHYVSVNTEIPTEKIFEQLEKRSFKQMEVFLAYSQLNQAHGSDGWVKRSLINAKVEKGQAALNALVKKEILHLHSKEEFRILNEAIVPVSSELISLSPAQKTAFDAIKSSFEQNNVTLLHGVTSSGKTEIYIKLIQAQIDLGKQVLFLLPEIALTTQIILRLRKYFGEDVGVYHSRYNMHEKIEIWKHSKRKYKIILGARSALFMPFENLGLVIVDEEHDASYKQSDPAPRYNARDAAIYLAYLHGAKTLLGSATPSIETYYNTQISKYGLVELKERFGGVLMPQIYLSDLKKEAKNGLLKSHLSTKLYTQIELALQNQEQVILFQNRRGFAPRIECEECAHTPTCIHCDVTLSYHKKNNHLLCHYCGYSQTVPAACPSCGKNTLKWVGFGTEKIEEELQILFPQAHIARMDLDSTRSKNAYTKLFSDFEEQKIDILVGTQMVTKGLDFENVRLVGVLNADNLINFPDFRAFERSFQTLTQVSGRAGRKEKKGIVIIQSNNPAHPIIQNVVENEYEKMYTSQISERHHFAYPPFIKLIKISLRAKEEEEVNKRADELAALLRHQFPKRILGPEYPLISRIQNYYIKNIIIKIDKNTALKQNKELLQKLILTFDAKYSKLRINIDVDPYS